MDVGRRRSLRIEQQVSRHLDEAEAARRKLARLDPQVLQVVEREPEAAVGERGERLSFSIGPAARRALWVNSSTSDGAIARLASRKSSSCWNTAASVSVDSERLQNRPISRFLSSSRRTTCTQRKTTRLSIFAIRPARSRLRDEIGGQQHVAGLGAQPRHRLVVAHLALRQRHDRLQIEVDAIGVDGARGSAQAVPRRRCGVRGVRRLGCDRRSGHAARGRAAMAAIGVGDTAGAMPPPAGVGSTAAPALRHGERPRRVGR